MPTGKRFDWNNHLSDILYLAKTGISSVEIANRYNISRSTITKKLNKLGIDTKDLYLKGALVKRKQDDCEFIFKRKKLWSKATNAKNKGIDFELIYSDIDFPTHCPILGLKLDYNSKGLKDNCPSFDRINPKLGYIKENVAIISNRANRMKSNGTLNELILVTNWYRQKLSIKTSKEIFNL